MGSMFKDITNYAEFNLITVFRLQITFQQKVSNADFDDF